ncbi:ras association domain-containing protein 10 [Cololabis saira]|uniref:ras association domain-containing protein 10 n=1 Tax=Cololabis saira TaxID=129043 RepID=UPI002AD449E9|nr:ras association domain-containing protein 10 [Cololabis saira]
MESVGCEISVWVCREEKLVLGLSKRTTCADVVKVLQEERSCRRGPAHSHCIVEKWRGFERVLPHKTRMLRLWLAWGEEQRNVKFVLVKSEASLAQRGARSAEARLVPSKPSLGGSKGPPRPPAVGSVSPEKQRRVVRKAFRKLEKINKKKTRAVHSRDASCAEKMETLVHVVVSQDHTIRQQIQRIAELDTEIETCEAKVHFDRIQINGVNYVQNCYLVDAAPASSPDRSERAAGETLARLEEHVRLQEELLDQETLIESITAQIQEELNHRWTHRRKEELCRASSSLSSADTTENDLSVEEERIKTQLDASLYIGLRLNADLQAIRSDLELSQQIYSEREKEMRDLLEKVNSLDMEEGEGEERCCHGAHDMKLSTLEMKCGWVEQARGLSKDHSVNDEDSDTGLSSLHSQDSDSLTVWESLV